MAIDLVLPVNCGQMQLQSSLAANAAVFAILLREALQKRQVKRFRTSKSSRRTEI